MNLTTIPLPPSHRPSAAALLLVLAGFLLAGCGPVETKDLTNPPGPATLGPAPAGSQNWRLAVTGMHCDGCVSGLRSELLRTPGVSAAVVSLEESLALVTADTNFVTFERLTNVVAEAGFKARLANP